MLHGEMSEGCLEFFCLDYHFPFSISLSLRGWGWSCGVMVLGKLPVPGRSTNLDYSMERALQ